MQNINIRGVNMNYYNEIKNTLIKNETYKKVKDYSKNRSDLNTYYEVGRLLVEAQGGETRAKYGNKLIKQYSMRLTKELGRGYCTSNLKDMRQVFIKFSNRRTLFGDLSWNHYVLLSRLSSSREIEYYIHITKAQNLSIRELKERIKLKEYERIGYKEELEEPKVSTLIKNPIIIKTKDRITDEINEYALHQFILDDMENFLKELGNGFTFYGHEEKKKDR